MFFLALYSMRIKAPSQFFIGWLTMAAALGEPSAQHWLARTLLDQEKPESAYWLARSILEHGDGESVVVLCWMLWKGPEDFRRERLAECLLVSEVNRGNGSAVMQLGWFYVQGGTEVMKKEEIGKKLLEIAAVSFENEEARQKLQELEEDPTILDYVILFGLSACVIVSGIWFFRKVFRKG
jgi:TPR repeat protein